MGYWKANFFPERVNIVYLPLFFSYEIILQLNKKQIKGIVKMKSLLNTLHVSKL